MIRVGIVGATGYTGLELIRILSHHPEVEIAVVTSRSDAGKAVSDFFPSLRCICDLTFDEPKPSLLRRCDIVFFATPHAVSMHSMKELLDLGVRVIDLSADFRIKNIELWEEWYGCKHVYPEGVDQAVYGLPELNRVAIKGASLVAAPGCYPTSIQLGFLPLLEAGLVDTGDLIANSASGVSGAGRAAKIDSLYTECNENFRPYAANGHRHLPETEQGLELIAGQSVNLTFVPHLLPMSRGIISTLYANVSCEKQVDLQELFTSRYKDEYFVDVLPRGQLPSIHSVRGSNFCRIAVEQPQGRDKVLVMVAIDNLVKGASGQAVQIMNIMTGIDEKLGLGITALAP